MLPLALSLLVSALTGLLILRSATLHRRYSLDVSDDSLRKVHAQAVPRIGGIAVLAGLSAGAVVATLRESPVAPTILMIILCGLPAFLGGLIEDLTGKVSPLRRLLAISLSAVLAYLAIGVAVTRVDLPVVDALLMFAPVQIILTVVCVAALTNAINIIDGLNGLASMVCIIILGGLVVVGLKVVDYLLVTGSLIMIGALAGFAVWNYPGGHLFLGDGGAYLCGFITSALVILGVQNNPQISPWFAVLLLVYPITELLFSIWRRKILRKKPAAMPDAAHLHHLIYRRVVRWAVGSRVVMTRNQRNSAASPYLWGLTSLAVIPAVIFHDNGPVLMSFTALFAVTYVFVYARIVRWGVQRWFRGSR